MNISRTRFPEVDSPPSQIMPQSRPAKLSATHVESEREFESWDGVRLFYRAWHPNAGPSDRAVILFHRGHEHSGRWHDVIEKLALADFSFFAWDARGHGAERREERVRGFARC